ncbi:MAG: hypothetical protein H7070_04990 [Saprospiraceae bacterium]|nr:hypothetical protein [Pyrinomonadaceae bacterium]
MTKIKVVKKVDAAARPAKKRKNATPRNAAREMVMTVTGWVADIKHRKADETKAALDVLFGSNQQPNEG